MGSWVVFFVINDNELNDNEDVGNKTSPTDTCSPRDHASIPRTTEWRGKSTIVPEVIFAPQTRGRQLEFVMVRRTSVGSTRASPSGIGSMRSDQSPCWLCVPCMRSVSDRHEMQQNGITDHGHTQNSLHFPCRQLRLPRSYIVILPEHTKA